MFIELPPLPTPLVDTAAGTDLPLEFQHTLTLERGARSETRGRMRPLGRTSRDPGERHSVSAASFEFIYTRPA
ncbi:hypothetical protein [Ramlibacter humi]|uniref:Uncharacterized protein n=1 Tax=Ramlibacter humi TaxID=2530451 RepID=A0A4Z0BZ76_9BURK|nr:hypothetical protein [Ramlibacter humi]TFZ03598.1 hypothetical protein EZ216_07975 [Ramlibacter humi]